MSTVLAINAIEQCCQHSVLGAIVCQLKISEDSFPVLNLILMQSGEDVISMAEDAGSSNLYRKRFRYPNAALDPVWMLF